MQRKREEMDRERPESSETRQRCHGDRSIVSRSWPRLCDWACPEVQDPRQIQQCEALSDERNIIPDVGAAEVAKPYTDCRQAGKPGIDPTRPLIFGGGLRNRASPASG